MLIQSLLSKGFINGKFSSSTLNNLNNLLRPLNMKIFTSFDKIILIDSDAKVLESKIVTKIENYLQNRNNLENNSQNNLKDNLQNKLDNETINFLKDKDWYDNDLNDIFLVQNEEFLLKRGFKKCNVCGIVMIECHSECEEIYENKVKRIK